MDQNNAKYRLFHAVPCFNYKKSSNYLLRKLKLKIICLSAIVLISFAEWFPLF